MYLVIQDVLILCLRGPEENAKLAEEVSRRLTAHKADNPSMGEVRKFEEHPTTMSPLLCCVTVSKTNFLFIRLHFYLDSALLYFHKLLIILWVLGLIS